MNKTVLEIFYVTTTTFCLNLADKYYFLSSSSE